MHSESPMPTVIKSYVRYVDALNRAVGSVVMYMIFAMMGVLLFASISRYFFNKPYIWVIELSQFMMAAYYLLGGGFSLQLGSHVRMDVLYERWKPRTKGFWDSITAFFLVFYLIVLMRGGFSSTLYSFETGQTNYSAWAPLMWPIKAIMTVGILLMLLQAIAMFFRDLARFTGRDIG
jgi:TRAP-type mannitol/chloroaromatic compound transport system permease small subunit